MGLSHIGSVPKTLKPGILLASGPRVGIPGKAFCEFGISEKGCGSTVDFRRALEAVGLQGRRALGL